MNLGSDEVATARSLRGLLWRVTSGPEVRAVRIFTGPTFGRETRHGASCVEVGPGTGPDGRCAMIGFWQPSPPDPLRHVTAARTAVLHGQRLVVEQAEGECCWHWAVRTQGGHVVEAGLASDVLSAEREAEEAAFHIHPPTIGDWVERLM